MGSKFYGARKCHTYEWPDAMQDVGFRAPTPRLAPQPPRLVLLPEELSLTSNATNEMRKKIREHIMSTLVRVASSIEWGHVHLM